MDNIDYPMMCDGRVWSCPRCGGEVGHLINCPDGSAFSGDRKTIKNNPLDDGGEDDVRFVQGRKV